MALRPTCCEENLPRTLLLGTFSEPLDLRSTSTCSSRTGRERCAPHSSALRCPLRSPLASPPQSASPPPAGTLPRSFSEPSCRPRHRSRPLGRSSVRCRHRGDANRRRRGDQGDEHGACAQHAPRPARPARRRAYRCEGRLFTRAAVNRPARPARHCCRRHHRLHQPRRAQGARRLLHRPPHRRRPHRRHRHPIRRRRRRRRRCRPLRLRRHRRRPIRPCRRLRRLHHRLPPCRRRRRPRPRRPLRRTSGACELLISFDINESQ